MKCKPLSRILVALFFVISHLPLAAIAGVTQPGPQEGAKAGDAPGAADFAARLAAVEKAVEEKRKETNVPGLSLAIVKDDQVVFAKGFGLKDVEHHSPVTADTLFAIGSATKAFTAMAAVMSADESKLSLDDSPKKYLSYFKLKDPDADANVTIRDLLCHRVGLMHHNDVAWGVGTLNREEVIRVAGLARPIAKLREKFQYNNIMYSAAGEVVASANHSTWEAVIASRILKPLGMTSTDTSIQEMQRAADFARGYEREGGTKQIKQVPMRDLAPIAPAGAINSNARDMAQWVRLMLGGGVFEGKRLVSEKGFAELVAPQMKLADKVAYGFGWVLMEWEGHPTVWHNGGIDGFHSLVEMMPDQKLGFVLLSNISDSPLEGDFRKIIWSNLVGSARKPEAAASPVAAQANGATLKELTGKYQGPGSARIEIAEKDGQVVLLVPGQPAYPLAEKEKDVLALANLPDTYRLLVKRDAGKVAGIVIKQPEGEFEFKRAVESAAPISVAELMSKVIDAAGGEANLRKHKSRVTTATLDLEQQGVTGEATFNSRAPNSFAQSMTLIALGKKIGWVYDFFDGASGGERTSFSPPETSTPKQVEEARVENDFYQLLNWKTLYKDVAIKRMDKVGDEEVYVVVKTPEKGSPLTEYISTKTFLILKRDKIHSSNAGEPQTIRETYSDFRLVDGCRLPFKLIQHTPDVGDTIIQVKEIKFDAALPDATFRAPAARR
ncbi:MAG TPA: serine hydrolase [Blastocatellia bacterium]|nr:serine hydrolase [Blastocatellia bacterium]